MASYPAQSKFCRPEEDPFLLLDRPSRSRKRRFCLPSLSAWHESMPSILLSAPLEKSSIAKRYWQQLRSAGFCYLGRWHLSELMQAAISAACFISFPAKRT